MHKNKFTHECTEQGWMIPGRKYGLFAEYGLQETVINVRKQSSLRTYMDYGAILHLIVYRGAQVEHLVIYV